MTDVKPTGLGWPDENLPVAETAPGVWDKLEAGLDTVSEYLNPILVKEARQALKSRQFAITFTLLLVCGWGWSLVGIAMIGPGAYYAPVGTTMLYGYYAVLIFPLLLLIPFVAFWSLAVEQADGTYELLSITSLAPRQIVGGKLGSSVLQMLVYLSALSPCIAFTYMLRGIDILTIALILYYVFLTSVIFSVLGLVLSTITRERHWQVLLSVAIVILLVLAFVGALQMGWGLLFFSPVMPFDNRDFWIGNFTFLTAYASYFMLFYLAAAARISFASDNRSTRLRIVMLAQHLLLLGWFAYYWIRTDYANELLAVYMCCAGIHWYVMGIFMTGESGRLSPRARRALPQSLVGRALLTWFNPGPGTGYVFAIANLSIGLLLVLEAVTLRTLFGLDTGYMDTAEMIAVSVAAFCYVVIYLGVGRLIMILLRKIVPAGIVLSVLLHILLLLAGMLVPMVGQVALTGEDDYTPLQVANPFWTVMELADGNDAWDDPLAFGPIDIPVVSAMLAFGAGTMLLLQLAIASVEIRPHVRAATPRRVEEEEALLHPLPPAGPSSPWDDEPAAEPAAAESPGESSAESPGESSTTGAPTEPPGTE